MYDKTDKLFVLFFGFNKAQIGANIKNKYFTKLANWILPKSSSILY